MRHWLNSKTVRFILILVTINILLVLYLVLPYVQAQTEITSMERGQNLLELEEDTPLIQTFFVFTNLVTGIELWLDFNEGLEDLELRVEVWDNRTMNEYLNQTISVDSLKNKSWNKFSFQHELIGGAGQEFYLKLTLQGGYSDSNSGEIALASTEYPDNHLLVYGTEISEDFAMKLNSRIQFKEAATLVAIFLIGNFLAGLSYYVQNKQQKKYPEGTARPVSFLDLLRGGSAFLVFLIHYSNILPWTGWLHQLAGIGSHGVEIFMLISGYLAVASARKRTAGTYYLTRIFRILPVYYAVMVIMYLDFKRLQTPFPEDISGLGWLRYLFCITTTVPTGENFWVNLCATWTIPCFVLFYLLVPLLNRWIYHYRSAVRCLAVTFVLGNFLIPILFHMIQIRSKIEISLISEFFPLRFLWYFCVGNTVYYAILEEKQKNLITLLLVLLTFRLSGFLTNSRIEWTIIGAILLIVHVNKEFKPGILRNIIGVLSTYSYSLYLVHPLLFNILGTYRMKINNDVLYMEIIAVSVAAGTYFMHHLWEEPWVKIGNKLIKKKNQKILEKKVNRDR